MVTGLAERTATLEQTGTQYGWRTTVVGNLRLLTLSQGVTGVAMAAHNAAVIRRRLTELGLVYPTVPLPGPRQVEVFIAGERTSGPARPASTFVALVLRNTRIPIPPSLIAGHRLEWTVPPGDHVPDLGTLMTVIQEEHQT